MSCAWWNTAFRVFVIQHAGYSNLLQKRKLEYHYRTMTLLKTAARSLRKITKKNPSNKNNCCEYKLTSKKLTSYFFFISKFTLRLTSKLSMKFSFTVAAFVAIAFSQITSACEDRKCGENDWKCISACVNNINKCLDNCGGGQSCYNQCVSEWTPTITASDGSPVSTNNPLGTATADISGANTMATATGTDIATASVPTGSVNTAAGSSVVPSSMLSASASLATAFSSASMSLSSQFSVSLQSAASSVSAAASSATASTTASSAAAESYSFSSKVFYTACAMVLLAVAL